MMLLDMVRDLWGDALTLTSIQEKISSALLACGLEVTSISTVSFRSFLALLTSPTAHFQQFLNGNDRVFDGLAISSFDDNKRRKVAVIVVVTKYNAFICQAFLAFPFIRCWLVCR
jgi:hypothetical protein